MTQRQRYNWNGTLYNTLVTSQGRLCAGDACPHTRFVACLPRHQPSDGSEESEESNTATFAERVDALR
jgi:hypothetical protein